MKRISLFLICAIMLGFTSCKEEYPDLGDGIYAEINTNKGTVVAELYYQATPITVANFIALAEGKSHKMVDSTYKGKKFYDNLIFHRVIKDFMIQGGDPTGTGSGGPGYRFPDEIVDTLSHSSKGILSMANAGPGTNGSQFFITLNETPWLDGRHTVFGKVVQGMETVDTIGAVETGPSDKPVNDVVIESVNIIRKGKEAKDFNAAKVFEDKLAEETAREEEKARQQQQAKAANAERFNALKEQAQELESGLQIHFIENAEGPKPQPTDKVAIHYAGYFADGGLFDTSMEDVAVKGGIFNQQRKDQIGYNPMVVPYGPEAPVIAGFKEAFQQMTVGDKVVVFIPSHLGYGPGGYGNVIPPNSDLIFEMEMVGIQE